jgi:hypothetical protein
MWRVPSMNPLLSSEYGTHMPDYGLGFQVNYRKSLYAVPYSLDIEAFRLWRSSQRAPHHLTNFEEFVSQRRTWRSTAV